MPLDFNKLKSNSIVLTGFQFIEQNPLGFFEFDNLIEKVNVFEQKVQGFEAKGKLIAKSNGFEPIKGNDNQNVANKDLFVVSRAKSRPVLVFQNIEFSKQYHDNVFIIPIQSIHEPIKSNFIDEKKYLMKLKQYKAIVTRSKDVYNMYYIPETQNDGTVKDRTLILNDARFVHKSSLYGTAIENEISPTHIEEIGIRLSKMFNIEKLEKCNECVYNYENQLSEVATDDSSDAV